MTKEFYLCKCEGTKWECFKEKDGKYIHICCIDCYYDMKINGKIEIDEIEDGEKNGR